jgi:two-component system response regulator FixJ
MTSAVFVVDGDDGARDSLSLLLRSERLPCRSFSSAKAFLAQLRHGDRGCLVTDIRLPDMEGIALVQHLRELGYAIPVIAVTNHANVALAVAGMKAGLLDVIEKPVDPEVILAAVHQALRKAAQLDAKLIRRDFVTRRMDELTERERQILEALCDGQANKVIAQTLGLSPRTVEVYRASLMAKLEARSVADLVKMTVLSKAA